MKRAVGLGFGVAMLGHLAVHAGTIGAEATQGIYPSGIVIGGDVGYGYLSSFEAQDISPPSSLAKASSTTQVGHSIWGLHAGYDVSLLDRFLMGFEVGYKDLGQALYSRSASASIGYGGNTNGEVYSFNFNLTQEAVDFLVTSRIYVLNGLNIFGKVGPAYVRSKSNTQYYQLFGPGIATNQQFNQSIAVSPVIWRIRPELAIGVGYSFTNNIDVHVMYNYIDGSDLNVVASSVLVNNSNSDIGNLSTGIANNYVGIACYNAVSVGISYYFG